MSMPKVAIHVFPTIQVELTDGTKALGVIVNRAEDIQYAPGVTLKTQILSMMDQTTTIQQNVSALANLVLDMQTFLAEQLGYEFGNHDAATAWDTLYDLIEKVPSDSSSNL